MLKALNVVSITLLVAMVSIVPATLFVKYVPGIFRPSLQGIAVAAWLSGIASWYLARQAAVKEREAALAAVEGGHHKGSTTTALTVIFLVVAVGIAVGLHFYGGRLLDAVR